MVSLGGSYFSEEQQKRSGSGGEGRQRKTGRSAVEGGEASVGVYYMREK